MRLFDHQELATIRAALRYYQFHGMGNPNNRSDWIHALATDGETTTSLDTEGIDTLLKEIQELAIKEDENETNVD